MAKISRLPAAAALTGAEQVPLLQNGRMARAGYAALAAPLIDEAIYAAAEAAGTIFPDVASGLAATPTRGSAPEQSLQARILRAQDPDQSCDDLLVRCDLDRILLSLEQVPRQMGLEITNRDLQFDLFITIDCLIMSRF